MFKFLNMLRPYDIAVSHKPEKKPVNDSFIEEERIFWFSSYLPSTQQLIIISL